MRTIKAIRIFYYMYTVYTLFVMAVSDYKFIHAMSGLLFMWLSYIFLKLGFFSVKQELLSIDGFDKNNKESFFPLSSIPSWPKWKYVVSVVFAWGSTILTAKFYTGRNFKTVIDGLFGGGSAYYTYQGYFATNNLSVFSIAKVPYILMLAYITIIMVWSTIGIILIKKKIEIRDIFYLIGIISAYAYFGAARGTNFEVYIIFVIFAFCLVHRMKGLDRRSIRNLVVIFLVGVILVFIYRARIMDRGVELKNDFCPEIHFREDRLFASMFPTITNIGVSLFGYLGYGIYCIGVTISDICLASGASIISFFFPFGFEIAQGMSLGAILARTIDMGVKWTPDFVTIVNTTGIIFYFALMILLGKFMHITTNLYVPDLLKKVIEALIFIEMLSIPVGKFIFTSSSNIIMVLYTVLWFFHCGGFGIKIRIKTQN